MSEKKKYLVKAAESRKRHGFIWRYGIQWLYGKWALVALSEEVAQALEADWDVDIVEYTGQDVEYTTEIKSASSNPPQRDMIEILFNVDYEEVIEEPPQEEEPKKTKKRTRKPKTSEE